MIMMLACCLLWFLILSQLPEIPGPACRDWARLTLRIVPISPSFLRVPAGCAGCARTVSVRPSNGWPTMGFASQTGWRARALRRMGLKGREGQSGGGTDSNDS